MKTDPLKTTAAFDKDKPTVKDANTRMRQVKATASELAAGETVYLPFVVIDPNASKATIREHMLLHPGIREVGAGIELPIPEQAEWPDRAADASVVMTGKVTFIEAPPE